MLELKDGDPRAGWGESRTATSAFKRLSARLSDLGITRLADITGLDRIGIPVVQSVRPSGLANTVTQGKGPDLLVASISAIMEAAEQVFSERLGAFEVVHASAEKLGVERGRFATHMLGGVPADWPSITTAWVPTSDLLSGQAAWLPFELAHCAYTEPAIGTDGLFLASTMGLACAFDEQAAVLHALLECIERDAIARAQVTHGFFHRFRLDERRIESDALRDLIAQVHDAGCLAAFWQAPAAGKVTVIWCQIMETGRFPPVLPYPADGFAADPDPVAATMNALREAAQSRLAAISGARDDVVQIAHGKRRDWVESHRRFLAHGPRPLTLDPQILLASRDRGATLDALLDTLAQDGISSVLALRIDTEPCSDISAVRVLVPQLQPLN